MDDNGIVWTCGRNRFGCLGLEGVEENERVYEPREIEYFRKNNIMISDIQCGMYHNIAIDVSGYVYSWGYGECGPTGHGTTDNIWEPRKISL